MKTLFCFLLFLQLYKLYHEKKHYCDGYPYLQRSCSRSDLQVINIKMVISRQISILIETYTFLNVKSTKLTCLARTIFLLFLILFLDKLYHGMEQYCNRYLYLQRSHNRLRQLVTEKSNIVINIYTCREVNFTMVEEYETDLPS